MPSEGARRLHPASIIFNLAGPLKALIVPAGLFILPRGGPDSPWWIAAVALVFSGVSALVTYVTFTYEYGETELIVRSGLLFKRERHIPYGRIQNIDGRQHLLHRLLGVQTIVIETGGGSDAEATLAVLDEGALDEMRRRVAAGGAAIDAAPASGAAPDDEAPAGSPRAVAAPAVAGETLLALGLRDLVICGLVRGRGIVLALAAAGLAIEYGLLDRVDPGVFDGADDTSLREIAAAVISRGAIDLWTVAAAVVAGVVVLTIMRVIATVLTVVRLYGFTLVDEDGRLRMTYGLLTRVRAVMPVRRIQSVTVREGPLHRLFRMTSIRADTAGGEADTETAVQREWIAPIIARDAAGGFLARLLPGLDLSAVDWQPPHRRARRRAFVGAVARVGIIALPALWYLREAALPLVAALAVFAWWESGRRVRHMGLAVTGTHVLFRSGWYWRQTTIAPLDKVQTLALHETPFDRRHGMASLVVDTAGAAGSPHRLDVPWRDRGEVEAQARAMASRAAGSAFQW